MPSEGLERRRGFRWPGTHPAQKLGLEVNDIVGSEGGGTTVALSTDAFNALVGQLRKQQDQLAANQTKIETQLAAAKEEVRLARIAASRTGPAGRR